MADFFNSCGDPSWCEGETLEFKDAAGDIMKGSSVKKRRSASTPRLVANPSPVFRREDTDLAARYEWERENLPACDSTACRIAGAAVALGLLTAAIYVALPVAAAAPAAAATGAATGAAAVIRMAPVIPALGSAVGLSGPDKLRLVIASINAHHTAYVNYGQAPRTLQQGVDLVRAAANHVGLGVGKIDYSTAGATITHIGAPVRVISTIDRLGAIVTTRGGVEVLRLP